MMRGLENLDGYDLYLDRQATAQRKYSIKSDN